MCGNRRQNGHTKKDGTKSKKYFSSYSCTSRNSGNGACGNKEVKKEYIERFVTDLICEKVLSEKYEDYLIEEYEKHLKESDNSKNQKIKELNKKLSRTNKSIEKSTRLLIETELQSLVPEIKKLEEEKAIIEAEIKELSISANEIIRTKDEIRTAIKKARELLKTETDILNYLISAFIERIEVYEDSIVIKIKTNPIVFNRQQGVHDVAGAEGIEPSARGFGDRCSTI